MNVKSNLHAGMTFAECTAQRNYMKQAAQTGNCQALNQSFQPSFPTQLPSPPTVQPSFPTQLPSPPTAQAPIVGGYYGGTYYSDKSGWCL